MAQYEHLPIYKKAMDMAVNIENTVKGFSRYHKYTIGSDMRNLSRELVSLVIKANSQRDKLQTLTLLRDKSEDMKTLIILGKEIRAFKSFKQFQSAAALAVEISRQSEGWLKSQMTKRTESPNV